MKKILALYSAAAVAWGFVFAGCEKPAEVPQDGRFIYAPSDELFEGVDTASSRLGAASGLDFTIDSTGTPVLPLDPELMTDCDKDGCWHDCGETVITFDKNTRHVFSVEIHIAWPVPDNCFQDVSRTIEHEMIHSIRREIDLTAGVHSTHGVFQAAAHPDDLLLEDTSLTMVCEAASCAIFNPEVSQ